MEENALQEDMAVMYQSVVITNITKNLMQMIWQAVKYLVLLLLATPIKSHVLMKCVTKSRLIFKLQVYYRISYNA
jgi:hypothetical protein